jgi:hypothetical protein
MPVPFRIRSALSTSLSVLLLTACGKATEKAAEKMIESQAAKDGTQAKVDLQDGKARISTTDAQGQTSQLEMGGAKVSEADLGVPLYPGAQLQEGGSSRVETPDGRMVMVQLTSGDAPDKVAAYYREQLKSRAAGKQFMDASSGDGGATLVLGDEAAKSGIQIQVGKADTGSTIHISSTQGKKANGPATGPAARGVGPASGAPIQRRLARGCAASYTLARCW